MFEQSLEQQLAELDAEIAAEDARLARLLARQERSGPQDTRRDPSGGFSPNPPEGHRLTFRQAGIDPNELIYKTVVNEFPEARADLVTQEHLDATVDMLADEFGAEVGQLVDSLQRELKDQRERIRELEVEVRVVRGLASGEIKQLPAPPKREPHVA
jgi:hypothetical protein